MDRIDPKQQPDYVKRSVDLARQVLRDLKCIEGSEVRCCWTSSDPGARQSARIAALYIVFPGKPEARIDPESGELVWDVLAQPAKMIQIQNFATGGVFDDERIKAMVRKETEEYLQMFTQRPGCNSPEDFRLGEWDYA